MNNYAVGFVKTDKTKKPIYAYGEREKVNDFVKPYKTPNRCRWTQPVMCKYFETQEAMESHVQCVINTYSDASDGMDLTNEIEIIKV